MIYAKYEKTEIVNKYLKKEIAEANNLGKEDLLIKNGKSLGLLSLCNNYFRC